MEPFEAKSDDNLKAATILTSDEKRFFAASIHHYYYAVYQIMLHAVMVEIGGYSNENLQKINHNVQDTLKGLNSENYDIRENDGSHAALIHWTLAKLQSKDPKVWNDFQDKIYPLKKLRRKADYRSEGVSAHEVVRAKRDAEAMISALRKELIDGR
jgi:hypothetical protein